MPRSLASIVCLYRGNLNSLLETCLISKFKWLQRDSNPQSLCSYIKTQPFSQFGHVIEQCCEYLSVQCIRLCCYHVTCTFQSKSTLYSCLNGKEFLAWNRRNIWSLSDYNGTLTHNHLVRKRTLTHLAKLAKWLSCVVSTYLYGAFDCMVQSLFVLFISITAS